MTAPHPPDFTDADASHMLRALAAARAVQGSTWPNPGVGCVVVDEGGGVRGVAATAIGGRPHAEPRALAEAGADAARGSTVYVTLEPCSHFGKSPPCASALVDAGVGRVVVGTTDPDPRVSGRGLAMLRAAGIPCATGLLDAEAEELHRAFFHRLRTGRPWVSVVRPGAATAGADATLATAPRDDDATLADALPEAAVSAEPSALVLGRAHHEPDALRDHLQAWGGAGLTELHVPADDPLADALSRARLADDREGTPGALDGAKLVLATHNAGKLEELRALVGPRLAGLRTAGELGLPAPAENGDTYLDNALLKARAAAARLSGPAWVLADDGGIEVEVLDAAPGVHTARFAADLGGWAQARRELARRSGLLDLLDLDLDLDADARPSGPGPRARVHCVLALVAPDGREVWSHAAVDGYLRWPPAATGPGFAPIFAPSGGRAMEDARGVLLHRRLAFEGLRRRLPSIEG